MKQSLKKTSKALKKTTKAINKLLGKNMKLPKQLNNKWVLYLVLIVSIVVVLAFISKDKFDEIGIFVLVAVLSTYFSKNMIINLTLAIVITMLYSASKSAREGMKCSKKREGFEDGKEEEDKDKKKEDKEEMSDKKEKKDSKKNKKEKQQSGMETKESCFEFKDGNWSAIDKNQGECVKPMCWSADSTKCNADGFGQKQVPSSQPTNLNEEDDDEAPGKRIDQGATVELAYDNLQKMLGPDGIKGLTAETKRLAEQQEGLMNTIKDVAPILKTAKDTLSSLTGEKMDLSQLTKAFSNKN